MEQIAILTDGDVLGRNRKTVKKPMSKVRALVLRRDGRVAVFHAARYDMDTLPGGAMEPGETELNALRRELREEVGVREGWAVALGKVTERRGFSREVIETAYYVVRAEAFDEPKLTKQEKADDASIRWLPLAEAARRIARPVRATKQQKFLQARDTAALACYFMKQEKLLAVLEGRGRLAEKGDCALQFFVK